MVRIRLFGAIDLRDGDGRELGGVLAQPKRLALLAYLAAASPAGPQRRDTLLGLFWPDLDQDHARNALSQAVHFLRRSLGEATIVSRGGEELALEDSLAWADVRDFHAALGGGRPDEALELYRGDLLPSFFVPGCSGFEDWLERERARLRVRAAEAARLQAERHESAHRLTLAAGCARRAVELSDGDERHLRRMIELLNRVGDRVGAVRAYEQFAQSLAADLGVDPAPETVALIARVRADPTGHAATSGAGRPHVETVTAAVGRLTSALAERYRVERQLGAGAMAVVVLAQDLRHRRRVAIKVLRPELTALMGPERFLREIEIAAGLVHPHILPLHDSGEAEGVLYYVMPYVAGESLRDRLDREQRLPVAHALRIAQEVADALGYAHGQGFVHRDIKPENILLAGNPSRDRRATGGCHALVADFGIARAIGSAGGERLNARALSGTPAYMSPEQALGERTVDERTDVYALGCVLHEMLTGEPPFTGPTVEAVIARRLNEPAPRVSALRAEVPASLEAAIARSLARDAADRFATAGQFAEALAATDAGTTDGRRVSSRSRWIAGAAAALLVAGVGWLARPRQDGSPRADRLQSIAVLPFRSNGDSSVAYFAEGMTEELNGGLVRLQGVAVRPSATVRAEAARGGDPAELGRRLKAGYVLDGAVRRNGERSRLSLELVRVDSGVTSWSQTYDASEADVFAIRESVANEIAKALSLPLTPAVRVALARRGTSDGAARDLYLQAAHFVHLVTLEGAERAVDLFGQAIARDSGYADAWVGLAGAYELLAQLGSPTPIETLVLWRRAVDRAIELDSLNGEAYEQRAQLRQVFEWDLAAAAGTIDGRSP